MLGKKEIRCSALRLFIAQTIYSLRDCGVKCEDISALTGISSRTITRVNKVLDEDIYFQMMRMTIKGQYLFREEMRKLAKNEDQS